MTILHIITSLDDGGAEALLYRYCVKDKAHTHIVVSMMDGGKYGSRLLLAGVSVECLGMKRGRISLAGIWTLFLLLKNYRPDVVQTWMYHADLVGGITARIAGVKKVYWGIFNSTLEQGKSRFTTRVIARINAFLSFIIPSGIICCAEKTRGIHKELGYASNKLLVVPSGYDLQHFKPDAVARERLRDEWALDGGALIFGMVGRFDPNKDHYNLLHALSIFKQSGAFFHCVLVGMGLDAGNEVLVSWVKALDLGDEVLLLGQRDDIPAVMSAMDVHVLSSCAEAFPNVLAEAMACGTPCITTDVGDAAYIVGETGWVVPHSDSAGLAHAMRDALVMSEDENAWCARCIASRERIVDNFSIGKMLDAYQSVWDSCT